jgi:hypothetical protein
MSPVGPIGRAIAGLLVGCATVVLTACSSGKSNSTPPTSSTTVTTASTTSVPGSSTTAPPSNTSSTGVTTASTTTAPAGTSTTVSQSSVRITGFTISPAAPACNAPTMIQVGWTSIRATSVDLSIDGQKFASYGAGPQSHLEYFACDGKPHTYVLTARGPGGTATAAKTVRSTASS